MAVPSPELAAKDFIRAHIVADLEKGKNNGNVHTRFPPEPNGYLHIGHAKAICVNFGIAADFEAPCNLRFDDTNPVKEDTRFVDAIKEDIRWLGFNWEDRLFFASDYFQQLYDFALHLIERGLAYVDDLTPEEMREYRGTLTEPGKESPYRTRAIEENLDLFTRMRKGEFPNGAKTLRAKIDMSSGNLNMRDPVLYRIQHAEHHRTGSEWPIYPMYDYAHALSDALEGITHSLCSLEFEDHRPLYDWVVRESGAPHTPRQIEFARLNFNRIILSKRHLRKLVEEGHVSGWDDPRMPTLSGLRRRGFTPWAIRDFCERIGIGKRDSVVQWAQLEYSVRTELNEKADRVMAVLKPLKVVITNYPEGDTEQIEAVNNPEDDSAGTRFVPFTRELFIEQDDFMEDPPKKFFRLAPGREVRLKHAYFVTCQEAVKDDSGRVVELRCTYDPETKGGSAPDGRKVRGTLHWVSAEHGVPAEVRWYSHLFLNDTPNPENLEQELNPLSLEVLSEAVVEPGLDKAPNGAHFQFLRKGYFAKDPDSVPGRPVFNLAVTLKDSWSKQNKS